MYREAGLDAESIARTARDTLPERKARSAAKLVSVGQTQR
jgi:1-deoxy-D-xylulose-5-phosphate synthase